jgi:hypothetical protein
MGRAQVILTPDEIPAGTCNDTDGETHSQIFEDTTWAGGSVIGDLTF